MSGDTTLGRDQLDAMIGDGDIHECSYAHNCADLPEEHSAANLDLDRLWVGDRALLGKLDKFSRGAAAERSGRKYTEVFYVYSDYFFSIH